ncbi:hypothetical protein P43SY_009420 [Pythium insidiosum]|uniref:Adenylate kinase n=1 Tax=Pythium insidiosum TaxID=114742 RepID=A0AAD5M6J9_PYTIN|nr:hypothetical protein P43SY_009420 [Pythium insidiosum]
MLQLFINGPPGAGKTSLCKLLCDELRLEHVATGDLLRENILQRTPLGCVAKDCISRKALVPDHVVVDMVAEKILDGRLRQHAVGWVLDGFPRTPEQCAALRRRQIVPTVVVVLELSERECVQRITGRRFDPVTSRIYHMPALLPKEPGALARLTKRSDDAADRLPPRFEAYRQYGEATNALFRGVTHRVNALDRPERVLDAVIAILHANRPGGPMLPTPAPMPMPPTASPAAAARGNQQQPDGARGGRSTDSKRAMPQRIDEETEDDDLATSQFQYDSDDASSARSAEHQSRRLSAVSAKPLPPPSSPSAPATVPSRVSAAALPAPETEPDVCATDDSMFQFQSLHETIAKGFAEPAEDKAPQQPETGTGVESDGNNHNSPSPAPAAAQAPASTLALASSSSPSLSPSPSPSPSSTATLSPDFAKFRDLLLDGFEVLKHGRRGSPHARTIFTDMEFKRIFWMKPTKEAKAKKAKLDQSLLLADVVQVVRGMKTEVLKRSGDVGRYERYLSLVADDRTLDMELPTEAFCDFLLRGFEQLLFHGQDVVGK